MVAFAKILEEATNALAQGNGSEDETVMKVLSSL